MNKAVLYIYISFSQIVPYFQPVCSMPGFNSFESGSTLSEIEVDFLSALLAAMNEIDILPVIRTRITCTCYE